jgi:hypothetical protein
VHGRGCLNGDPVWSDTVNRGRPITHSVSKVSDSDLDSETDFHSKGDLPTFSEAK